MKNKYHNCFYCHRPMKYRGNRLYICRNKKCLEHGKLIQYEPNTLPPNDSHIPDIYPTQEDITASFGLFNKMRARRP